MRAKTWALVGLFTVAAACGDSGGQSDAGAAQPGAAVVTFVIDGDTIDVDIDGQVERVRLIGIDTPETTGGFQPPECFGDDATDRMRALLPVGTPVRLERDQEPRDRFDRLLAYVYRADDDLFINLAMVRDGFAVDFPFEPNLTYASEFAKAADEAQDIGIGLWAVCPI